MFIYKNVLRLDIELVTDMQLLFNNLDRNRVKKQMIEI